MFRFILNRLVIGILKLFIIFFIGIWIIHLIPGSYQDFNSFYENRSAEENFSKPSEQALFYIAYKLNKQSILGIEFNWNGSDNKFHTVLSSYVKLDFGHSLIDGVSVLEKFNKALPWTIALQLPALIFLIAFSIFYSMQSLLKKNNKLFQFTDRLLMLFHSVPGFWLATMLLLIFANPDFFQWFPTGLQSSKSINPYSLWFSHVHYLILPLICLVLPALAYLIKLIRNGLLEITEKEFWKRALSTGISFKYALHREALPIALIPLVSWFAGVFPAMLSGSVIIEQIFSIPGLGRLMYHSIFTRDWPMVQFLFIISSLATIIGFIVSDIIIRQLDPRIKLQS